MNETNKQEILNKIAFLEDVVYKTDCPQERTEIYLEIEALKFAISEGK